MNAKTNRGWKCSDPELILFVFWRLSWLSTPKVTSEIMTGQGLLRIKNATWRWQWAHLVICTHDMHTWTWYMWLLSSLNFYTDTETLRSENWQEWGQNAWVSREMRETWSVCRQTDRRTDRQKAMHRSPACNLHRWAQKHWYLKDTLLRHTALSAHPSHHSAVVDSIKSSSQF